MTLYGSGFDESGMRIKDAMAEIVEDEWVWHSGTGVEMGRCREWSDGKGKERWERGGVVNCLCTGRGWNKVETWKNIYMDRRRPPPPAGKWKITRPPPGWKCKLLLNPCKIVRILTVQNWAKFFHILPIVGKQLFTKPVENSVENLLITHSLWKTLWKTSCINIHHFCINIHPLHKYTFCTKNPYTAALYQFWYTLKTRIIPGKNSSLLQVKSKIHRILDNLRNCKLQYHILQNRKSAREPENPHKSW